MSSKEFLNESYIAVVLWNTFSINWATVDNQTFLGNYSKSGWNNMWDHLCLTKHISCWHFSSFNLVCGVSGLQLPWISLGLLVDILSSYVKWSMVYVYIYNINFIGLWNSGYLNFPQAQTMICEQLSHTTQWFWKMVNASEWKTRFFSPFYYFYGATLVVFEWIQVYCKFSLFIPFIIISRQLKSLTLC